MCSKIVSSFLSDKSKNFCFFSILHVCDMFFHAFICINKNPASF